MPRIFKTKKLNAFVNASVPLSGSCASSLFSGEQPAGGSTAPPVLEVSSFIFRNLFTWHLFVKKKNVASFVENMLSILQSKHVLPNICYILKQTISFFPFYVCVPPWTHHIACACLHTWFHLILVSRFSFLRCPTMVGAREFPTCLLPLQLKTNINHEAKTTRDHGTITTVLMQHYICLFY